MTPELLQALREGRPAAAVLTLALPESAGGPLYCSDRSLVSADLGPIRDLVRSWGRLTRALTDHDGNLATPAVDVSIADGTAAEPVGRIGRLGRRLEDVPATIHWAAEGVAQEHWSPRFSGRVVSRLPTGRGEWRLRIAVDDRALNRSIGPEITVDVWPSAATQAEGATGGESVLGLRAPVAYGTCDSTGLGSHGLRRCLYVETVGPWRWLYSLGDCAVARVFVDGEERTEGWTRTVEVRGGYTWTTVDFSFWPGKDPADKSQVPAITVDGDGQDVGAFGAATSPAAQLRHALEAFGRGRWSAATPPTAQLTDDASWDALEDWCTAQGAESGGVLGGGRDRGTLRSLLAGMLQAWAWSAYWTRAGQLAVRPESYVLALGPADPESGTWWVEGETLLEAPTYADQDPDQRAPGQRVRYCAGPDGQPLLSVVAMAPDRLESDPPESAAPLGPQRVVDPPAEGGGE